MKKTIIFLAFIISFEIGVLIGMVLFQPVKKEIKINYFPVCKIGDNIPSYYLIK